jgi:hypothetical protein
MILTTIRDVRTLSEVISRFEGTKHRLNLIPFESFICATENQYVATLVTTSCTPCSKNIVEVYTQTTSISRVWYRFVGPSTRVQHRN